MGGSSVDASTRSQVEWFRAIEAFSFLSGLASLFELLESSTLGREFIGEGSFDVSGGEYGR